MLEEFKAPSQSEVNEGGEGVVMLEVGRARSVGPYPT